MEVLIELMGTLYLPAVDREKAGEWYAKYFGLKPCRPPSFDCVLMASGQCIRFVETEKRTPLNSINTNGEEIQAVTFTVSEIQSLYDRFKEEGYELEWFDGDGCGNSFKMYDPDGNKLHFWGGYPK
jgi:hypothetical protein